jgi:hypothetical protein
VVALPSPDINVVCYVATHPTLRTLAEVNRFNEGIYRQLTIGRREPDYIITRTRVRSPHYDGAIDPVLAGLGLDPRDWRDDPGGLVVLRSTVMDPFLGEPKPATDHVAGFVRALGAACEGALGPVSSRDW